VRDNQDLELDEEIMEFLREQMFQYEQQNSVTNRRFNYAWLFSQTRRI
jgi:hypothetical protein